MTTAISYRSEPMRNRPPLSENHADTGEDISMSSWVYGDPEPPILQAYVGDTSKIRLIHGGVKETHVFHLHNHQWKLEEKNSNSTIIDSVSISPQECYTLDILHGAGSLNGTIGDVKSPPKKDEKHPGYPNFINGTFGNRPLQLPLGILDKEGNNIIEPTPLERENPGENNGSCSR